jgi:3-hydroxybutyryl-CoA dehydrogenase
MLNYFLYRKYILFIARIFAQNYIMTFVLLANDAQWNILKNLNPIIEWKKAANISDFLTKKNADAYFNLKDDSADIDYNNLNAPVFINSVTKTLSTIKATEHVLRINAWQGFLEKEIWEIAGLVSSEVANIIKTLNKKYITVDDEPGFVSARIIAMIINEAFFAKGENVSTEEEIDIAMKLGTNYPYGPFEWSKIIGIHNIFNLLKKLSETDERYLPAQEMENEINKQA